MRERPASSPLPLFHEERVLDEISRTIFECLSSRSKRGEIGVLSALCSFEKRKEEIFHEKSLGRKGFEDVERIFLKQHSGKWKGLDSKRGEGRGDSMEIELPAGRRRRNKVRGGFDEREVQVDANGRPLFFLLCFPSPDPHCSCNVPGPALLIS